MIGDELCARSGNLLLPPRIWLMQPSQKRASPPPLVPVRSQRERRRDRGARLAFSSWRPRHMAKKSISDLIIKNSSPFPVYPKVHINPRQWKTQLPVSPTRNSTVSLVSQKRRQSVIDKSMESFCCYPHDQRWIIQRCAKTTLLHHFYNASTIFLQHFYNTSTTLLTHFSNTFTTLLQRFYNVSTTFLQRFYIASTAHLQLFWNASTMLLLLQHFYNPSTTLLYSF